MQPKTPFSRDETDAVLGSDGHSAATLGCELRAEARSVRPALEPASIAVVGASRHSGTIGSVLLANLKRSGYRGLVYPVNPNAGEIDGVRCYPSVSAIGTPVDLALISVPAPLVERTIVDCGDAGCRSAVVISAGFGEVSEEGRRQEKRLRALARASGMRVIGPNCMGVLNTDPAVSMNATFVPAWPPPGNVGVLSQSGALGFVILERMSSLKLGLSTFVSVGNKADVTGEEVLAYWADDPRTQTVLLYLESIDDPRRFTRIAADLARSKPIVALKSGRSAAGSRAASSHSAALSSPDVAVDAVFGRAGVIRTDTLEELLDVSMLLSTQPVPSGNRVGIITNGGGPGILLTDACEAHGLHVPVFTEQTRERLRSFLPGLAGVDNPVDLIASATPRHFEQSLVAIGVDPNVDSVIVIYIPPQLHPPEEVASAVVRAAGNVPQEKPVVVVYMSPQGAPLLVSAGARGRIPSYAFPENAARALSAAHRYGRWRSRPRGSILHLDQSAISSVRAVVDRVLAARDEPAWLEPADLATVLRAAEIEFAATSQVPPGAALSIAEKMGYPLVLKVHAPRVVHKSDIGGVLTGIDSRSKLEASLSMLEGRMREAGISFDEVVLQREVQGGVEALVGATADPVFGPLLVCGLGGVLVEVLKDAAFDLAPVSDLGAEAMIDRLRGARLLEGYRGSPRSDRRALVDVVVRVSALAEAVPELLELDLNPVKVLEAGRGAVVVDARMRVGRPRAVPE